MEGSSVSGHTVLVQAGRDAAVQGSAVVADLGLGIRAGRDLTIAGVIVEARDQSKQSSSADSARGSSVTAGGNVSIKATGAGEGSDITVRGSEISAGGTTLLKADDQVNILAAQNSSTESSSQSSKSGSIGVGINLGAGGLKAGVTVSASEGKGQGAGNGTSYSNSHVSGSQVTIDSGGDTTIKGGVVKGDQVTALVGGNLSIESLQDKNQYREKSQQAGASVTFGPSPGGSVNAGKTKIASDYLSVGEQSAIRAGDGATQLKEAEKNQDQAGIEAWKEGGAKRVALHVVVGGLTGGVQGAVGAGAASAAAPGIDQLQGQLKTALIDAGLGDGAANVIASLAGGSTAAAIGAAANGGSAAKETGTSKPMANCHRRRPMSWTMAMCT